MKSSYLEVCMGTMHSSKIKLHVVTNCGVLREVNLGGGGVEYKRVATNSVTMEVDEVIDSSLGERLIACSFRYWIFVAFSN